MSPATPTTELFLDLTVERLALAIAKAEGFFRPNSLPERRNNPGSLTTGGSLIQFPTVEEGWNALKRQIRMMFEGGSSYYHATMTIQQVAEIYTGGDNPDGWAQIVASELGVTPNNTLLMVAALYG